MRETLEQLTARVNSTSFVLNNADPTASAVRKVMAKPVKMKKGEEFSFPAAGAKGAASKYPWDQWFDGTLLLLERSSGIEDDKGTVTDINDKRDFEVSVDAMVPKLKTAARRRYKIVQVSRYDADGNKLDGALIIRARDMSPEERQEEDITRAEEKANLAAKKATASTNGQTSQTSPAPTATANTSDAVGE